MDNNLTNSLESNKSSDCGSHQDYDFDYPSFESCSNASPSNSVVLSENSIPAGLAKVSNGGHSPLLTKKPQNNNVNHNSSNSSNSNNGNSTIETKVIKFPAKNVPKNPEKFFTDLKYKMSQLSSQIITTKLPCGGYNILVKSPREKAIDAVSLVERELQPKITKKLRLESRSFTLLTAKNFELAKETLAEGAKNVTVGSQQNNTLTLTGIASDVSRALQLITKYMDKASTSETLALDDIPPKFYSLIRGAFNCNITKIMAKCDNCVTIAIPPPSINSDASIPPITIVGPPEYQHKAKNEIIKVYNNVRKNAIVKTFKISSTLHANIRRACGLDKILKETNVAVVLPDESNPQDSVAFVGNSKDIPNAFHLSLARARVYVYYEVTCKPWILKIMKQKPHLSFDDLKLNFQHTWISYLTPKECIALDGPSEEVDNIKEIYTVEIEHITKTMTFTTMRVPASYLEHIQGIGSKITKRICDATDTKIDLSTQNINQVSQSAASKNVSIDNQITVITIFGKKEDIEEAGELFDEYITQLNEISTVEININSLLFPYVTAACVINSIPDEIKRRFGSSLKVTIKNIRSKRISSITFVGKKGAVLGAQSFIDDTVKMVTNKIAIHELAVPVAYHHLLVGKKGFVKSEIIDCSGVDKIIFPNASPYSTTNTSNSNIHGDDNYQSPPDVITLVGSLKACKLAEVLLIEKCNMDVELDQIDITLPKNLIEKLRLGDGIILRRIIANCVSNSVIVDDSPKSNAINVYLPNASDLQTTNVRVHGYKSYTKAVSEKLLNYATNNSLFVDSFSVDDDLIKSVIGRGGSQLKKFSEASSVDIIITSEKPTKGKLSKNNAAMLIKNTSNITMDNVYLMGTNQAEIIKIKNQIIKFVKELKDVIELTANVKKRYIKKFFMRRGETEPLISQLGSKYSMVRITMPKEEDNMSGGNNEPDDTLKPIRLKGPSKMVNNVHNEITNLVNKWDATIRIEFSIPYDHANLLRNIEQPNFASIGKEFDVTIHSFRDGDKATKPTSDTTISVVIEGVNKDVAAAKDKIYVCGPVTERFSAPRQFHRSLIGTKGAELKRIVEGFNVNITFPDPESHSDDILIRGPKQQLKPVIDRLKEALEMAKMKQIEWEKNNHTVEMAIDPIWFSKLIGRGGKHIKALKTKLNVAIIIPKNDESASNNANTNNTNETNNQSQIIFRGDKNLCEQAQKTIESMVNEWENTVTTEFELPKAIHGKIRGARSVTLTKIQKKFRVEVRFAPIEEEENNTIKVTGLQQNVDDAISHIQELATQFLAYMEDNEENEHYQIPTNLNSWNNFKFTAVDESPRVVTGGPSASSTTTSKNSQRASISMAMSSNGEDGCYGADDEQQAEYSDESMNARITNVVEDELQHNHSNHSVSDLEPLSTPHVDSLLDDQQSE